MIASFFQRLAALRSEPDLPAAPFLSRDDCIRIGRYMMREARNGGDTNVTIESMWHAELAWAKNRVTVATDRRENNVRVDRVSNGSQGSAITNQIDEVSLEHAVRCAEWILRKSGSNLADTKDAPPPREYPKPAIWSDGTLHSDSAVRGRLIASLTASAESAGLVSAGFVSVGAVGRAVLGTYGYPELYFPRTAAECSITVRDPRGTASGWAGTSSYDWGKIDPVAIAETATHKCLASRNPVAIEPGRYTTILEPQAVFSFVSILLASLMRDPYEGTLRIVQQPGGYFTEGHGQSTFNGVPVSFGTSLLGKQVMDRRLTLRQDPMDPQLGTDPFRAPQDPFRAITWVDRGVLTHLATDSWYAQTYHGESAGFPSSGAARLESSEPPASIESMIAGTERGVLVTRFGPLEAVGGLFSAYTRDGIWLVKEGKISMAIKNFRAQESPLFVLNQVDQIGAPMPVFNPPVPALIPALKVRDFNFVGSSDAV